MQDTMGVGATGPDNTYGEEFSMVSASAGYSRCPQNVMRRVVMSDQLDAK